MSIIDDVLVLLDDETELSLDEIKKNLPRKSVQSISSALGRLTSKGWVTMNKKNNSKIFKISSEGRQVITRHLNRIREKENNKWDHSWLVVVFSIPEKQRKARDLFRKSLVEKGFLRLHNELWISFWDRRKAIEKEISLLKINTFCTVFKISKLTEVDQKNVVDNLIWNEKKLNDEYKDFINSAKSFLKTKKEGYKARLLVYKYSQTVALDPNFPDEIEPKDYLGDQAYKIYLKIRPYCYK
jgi:phenylacetic acid degradation operon negative regulatory protein